MFVAQEGDCSSGKENGGVYERGVLDLVRCSRRTNGLGWDLWSRRSGHVMIRDILLCVIIICVYVCVHVWARIDNIYDSKDNYIGHTTKKKYAHTLWYSTRYGFLRFVFGFGNTKKSQKNPDTAM